MSLPSPPDQIALPDFYFGAMENWGLVTYRETNLLYDPVTSSNSQRERTATIIAHELAHMVLLYMHTADEHIEIHLKLNVFVMLYSAVIPTCCHP